MRRRKILHVLPLDRDLDRSAWRVDEHGRSPSICRRRSRACGGTDGGPSHDELRRVLSSEAAQILGTTPMRSAASLPRDEKRYDT